jgi:hypothetical protein
MTDSPREHDLRTETGVCNGRCIGHASELSTSEWRPDSACPLHGTGQQPAQPDYDPLASKDHSEALAALTQPTYHSKSEAKRVTAMQARPGSGEAADRLRSLQRAYGCIPGIGTDLNRDVAEVLFELTAAQQRIADLHEALRGEGESAEGWTDDDYLQAAREGDADAREVGRLAGKLSIAEQRIAALESELSNERARDIHTCHDQCERPLCVAQRRIRELEHQLAVRSVS